VFQVVARIVKAEERFVAWQGQKRELLILMQSLMKKEGMKNENEQRNPPAQTEQTAPMRKKN
jgi:hypothetical protein